MSEYLHSNHQTGGCAQPNKYQIINVTILQMWLFRKSKIHERLLFHIFDALLLFFNNLCNECKKRTKV